jgi:hypothetical protein
LGDCVAAVFAAPRGGKRPFAAVLLEELPDCELPAAEAFFADPSALLFAAELCEEPEEPPLELAEEDLLAVESEPFAGELEVLISDELLLVELLPSLVVARSTEKISPLEELAEPERFALDDEVLVEELPILNATGHQSVSPRVQ